MNLARALARLGLRTLLVTHSDPVHRPLLEQAFEASRSSSESSRCRRG